jgi:hypothetical protein
MHALCNAFLSHRPTLMSPFSKGLRKNCRFQLWPWHFLGRTGSPLLCPTLCRPKISGSAYFGKSRGNQTWRLSHSVKAYPQFRSSYSHEEMVEHFLLTPAELRRTGEKQQECDGNEHRGITYSCRPCAGSSNKQCMSFKSHSITALVGALHCGAGVFCFATQAVPLPPTFLPLIRKPKLSTLRKAPRPMNSSSN